MGCDQSTASGNNAERDKEFRSMVSKGNVLAVAINEHWSAFMKENDFKKNGDKSSADRMRNSRQSKVQVNRDAEQAKSQKLTFEVSSRVADCFLGHAMTTLGTKNWGGSVRHNLRGAAGKESTLVVTGSITFTDNANTKFTVPYNVDFNFYLC